MLDKPNAPRRGRYYGSKDLQRLFNVSRATIDRWCREIPGFPKKIKLGVPGSGSNPTRFLIAEVEAYLRSIEAAAGIDPDI